MTELGEIEARIADAEAQVPHLRPACAKAIVWADGSRTQTDLCVVFVHGFSASCGELRPLPERVATGLGANLFLTRLMGHGQDGDAMGAATLEGWRADLDEALAIGQQLGRRVLLMGCSTGCTLIADALCCHPDVDVAGCCFISPNFGLRNIAAQTVLDLPGSSKWAPRVIGQTRTFPVLNDLHREYWTTTYPTKAVKPMGEIVRAARRADVAQIAAPLLMAINPRDTVINPNKARAVARKWGGPTRVLTLVQTDADDAMGHIMAGDAFSPGQTGPLSDQIRMWAKNL